jgi:hypothetical protein
MLEYDPLTVHPILILTKINHLLHTNACRLYTLLSTVYLFDCNLIWMLADLNCNYYTFLQTTNLNGTFCRHGLELVALKIVNAVRSQLRCVQATWIRTKK